MKKKIIESPVLLKKGKTLYTDKGEALKKLKFLDIEDNIVIFHSPEGNLFKGKGWTMIYFMDTPDSAKKLQHQTGEIDLLTFIPGSLSMRFGGYSMIDDIWKKKKNLKGVEHIIGALEAYVDDKDMYIDNLSVRPGYRRNSIATKMVDELKDTFPNRKISHSDFTDQGAEWNKSYKLESEIKLKHLIFEESCDNIDIKKIKYFYHATFKDNLSSIMINGIKKDNVYGGVFLADSSQNAAKFLMFRVHNLSDIIVFKMDASKLNKTKLEESYDHSYEFFKCRAYIYFDNIKPNAIDMNNIMGY